MPSDFPKIRSLTSQPGSQPQRWSPVTGLISSTIFGLISSEYLLPYFSPNLRKWGLTVLDSNSFYWVTLTLFKMVNPNTCDCKIHSAFHKPLLKELLKCTRVHNLTSRILKSSREERDMSLWPHSEELGRYFVCNIHSKIWWIHRSKSELTIWTSRWHF